MKNKARFAVLYVYNQHFDHLFTIFTGTGWWWNRVIDPQKHFGFPTARVTRKSIAGCQCCSRQKTLRVRCWDEVRWGLKLAEHQLSSIVNVWYPKRLNSRTGINSYMLLYVYNVHFCMSVLYAPIIKSWILYILSLIFSLHFHFCPFSFCHSSTQHSTSLSHRLSLTQPETHYIENNFRTNSRKPVL